MRTIKFRGYNKKNEWLYGYYFVNRGKHYIVDDVFVNPFATPEDFEVVPYTIGQYSDERDDFGNDIYEGDIVSWPISIGEDIDCIVVFHDNSFMLKHINEDIYLPMLFAKQNVEMKVIGNIHTNPELLKGGER